MRRSTLLVLLAVCALAPLRAPAEARAELEQLMRGMASSPGVIARFVETKHLSLLDRPLESQGILYFVPPDRMVREVTRPGSSRLVIDRGRLAIRDEAGAQDLDLERNPLVREVIDSFIVLFGGDLPALERRYQLDFEVAEPSWRLLLVPRASTVRRLIARVEIRGDRTGLRELSLFEQDGDRSVTRLVEVDARHRFTERELGELFGDAPR